MTLLGGRYACAQILAARRLSFLHGRSLGEISHIIQLAISQKKLLGYLKGTVVPYKFSQSMAKERLASEKQTKSSASRDDLELASWETIRSGLLELIDNMQLDQETIPLSNMKRMFGMRFQLDLSETKLGYCKLSDLFKDDRLSDICSVRLQLHGYVLVPKKEEPPSAECSEQTFGTADVSAGAVHISIPEEEPQNAGCDQVSFNHRRPLVQHLTLDEFPAAQASPSAAMRGCRTPSGVTPLSTQKYRSMQVLFPPTPSPMAQSIYALPMLLGSTWGAPACALGLCSLLPEPTKSSTSEQECIANCGFAVQSTSTM
mmetsp:Transcript_95992/g.250241  ORF Transcript_95992/g.250241 Transcript_95992/m.250241 type:complete len:316 (-) Transcript_95992:427-1374(-)